MKTHVIDNWAGLRALEPEWNELLRRSRANCPFLTWEWATAWRAVAGDSIRPLVVVVRDETGALAGIGPFYLTSLRLGGIVSYRSLRILGDHQSGAEYLDWIVREDREREATLAIARALKGIGDRWDCMWIPYVSGWTGAHKRIAGACASLGFYCHERPNAFAALDLPADYSSYERSLSRNARAMLQKRRRQIFSLPGLSVERCRSEEELPAFLEALFDLNHRRWSTTGQAGTFVRKPLEAQFYREFTRVALARGWLRLFALKIGGEFKAVQSGYVYDRTFYQVQEGFDPRAPQGIGNVLRGKVIEHCIMEGLQTYDFLSGFTEHKRRWLAKPRTGHDLFIGRRGGLKTALLFSAEIWPTGRYLRPAGFPSRRSPQEGTDGAPGAAAAVATSVAAREFARRSQAAPRDGSTADGLLPAGAGRPSGGRREAAMDVPPEADDQVQETCGR